MTEVKIPKKLVRGVPTLISELREMRIGDYKIFQTETTVRSAQELLRREFGIGSSIYRQLPSGEYVIYRTEPDELDREVKPLKKSFQSSFDEVLTKSVNTSFELFAVTFFTSMTIFFGYVTYLFLTRQWMFLTRQWM